MRLGEETENLGSGARDELRRHLAMVRQILRVWLPGEIAVTLPCLGDLILRTSVLAGDAAWLSSVQGSSCESTQIECAGSKGTLAVERGFALHIVNTLVGCESALASGPLSRIERGLLHGALVGLAGRLHLPPEVRVSVGAPAPAAEALVIEVSMVLGEVSGRAWMCASLEFLSRYLEVESAGSSVDSQAVRIELGRTRVPRSDLNAAQSGDLVVFDEVRALSEEEAWTVHLRHGDSSLPASLCLDGALVFARENVLGRQAEVPTWADGPVLPVDGPRFGEKAKAQDDLAAEIGCISPAALAAYLRGLPMNLERAHRILLRRNGMAWAEGDLLAFENAMAVRITRLVAG